MAKAKQFEVEMSEDELADFEEISQPDEPGPPPVPAYIPPKPVSTARRFEIPDIDRHGLWLVKRLVIAYPHLIDRQIPGWLRGVVYNSEFHFLYQENSVGLAQMVRPDPFTPTVVIWERFVWAKDPKNPEHVAEAALFYEKFKKWASFQSAGTMVVGENTDVPADLIRQHLGRLYEKKSWFAKLG